jgi:hypothetical protein
MQTYRHIRVVGFIIVINPESCLLVQVLDDLSSQLDVIANDLLVGCYAIDSANTSAQVAVDNGTQLAVPQLLNTQLLLAR